jgi:hypothetical protein
MLYAIVGLLLLLIDQFMSTGRVPTSSSNATGQGAHPRSAELDAHQKLARLWPGQQIGGPPLDTVILLLAVTAFIVLGLSRRYLLTGLPAGRARCSWRVCGAWAWVVLDLPFTATWWTFWSPVWARAAARASVQPLQTAWCGVRHPVFAINPVLPRLGEPPRRMTGGSSPARSPRRYYDEDDEDEDDRPPPPSPRYEDEEERGRPAAFRRDRGESAAVDQRARCPACALRPSAQETPRQARGQPFLLPTRSDHHQTGPPGATHTKRRPRAVRAAPERSEQRDPPRPAIVPEETAPARRETVRPAAPPESEATVRTVERPAARPQTAAAPAPAPAVTEATAAPKASAETAADEFDLDSILAEFK